MKRVGISISVLILVFCALLVYADGPSKGMIGTWKLDPAKSKYSGAVPKSQVAKLEEEMREAAKALGLSPIRQTTDVVLPQAVKIVIPPITSNAINVIKDTALASVVAMPDLLKQATQAQALAANPTPLISAALIYIAILLPLVRLVAVLEKRLARRGR